MSSLNPARRETTVEKSTADVRAAVTSRMKLLKGKNLQSNDTSIECDFGSLMKSRVLGEFWVPKSLLPKKASVRIEETQDTHTKITIEVRDTHKWGVKWGFVKKYQKALDTLADSLLASIQDTQDA